LGIIQGSFFDIIGNRLLAKKLMAYYVRSITLFIFWLFCRADNERNALSAK